MPLSQTAGKVSGVDGIGYDSAANMQPGIMPLRKLNAHGQTGNTVATRVANQWIDIVAAPALAAAATGTVTVTNSLITAKSLIFTSVRRGTTTAAAGAGITVEAQAPAAGSCVLSVRNPGSAASLSTDYQILVLIFN